MAVFPRRPRCALLSFLAVSLIASACSLVKPAEAPVDLHERARSLVEAGNHADAARLYAQLAADEPAERDDYELLSAEQWVAAGRVADAKQALGAASAAARAKQPTSFGLVAAEIAVAESDGAGALRELDAISVPAAPDLAQNYWYLRGEAFFLRGSAVEGTRAFVERERYLSGPAVSASRQELFAKIRGAAQRGSPLTPPAQSDPIVAGWLQLGTVAVELQRDPLHAAAALGNWQALYPQHPAAQSVLAAAQTQIAVANQFPNQIALLLPLSGRAEAAGTAVRDGFIAGYLDQDAASRPRLKVYDVAAESVAGAYQHAIQDGASFVVGPLTKEDVAAVAPLAAGRMPVLALNFLADSSASPQNFYQFALLPEDEARIVARRLVAEGKRTGVAILPDNEWGTRVGAAFADELTQLGGTVADSGRYETGRSDFSDVIKQTLQIHGIKGEPAAHRSDAEFVFVAGTPAALRLMVAQLKFHFAGDIPRYSTSDSFEPSPGANSDLDGLFFPDMPWMVSADPVTTRIRDAVRAAWPARTARLNRLFAFGFDAYRLVPALRAQGLAGANEIDGVTGRLRLDDRNRIRRELDWAQIRDGQAAPLEPPPPEPAPPAP
jgi:outer membrane PBP1 activator LpoA protein